MTEQEVLDGITVDGMVAYLPPVQLERKTYQNVAKKLQLIGGKWKGGKIGGFVFQQDPSGLIDQVRNGEKRNLKKEYQFFETPAELADRLIELAHLPTDDLPWLYILEPSAGQGAIAKAIRRVLPDVTVDCYESMELNRKILAKVQGVHIVGDDFLGSTGKLYDYIIANPPFTKNQDIDHIRHMYERLATGGRIVTVASVSWTLGKQKKHKEFREWLEEIGAEQIDLPAGTFKESGTSVPSVIIIIDK